MAASVNSYVPADSAVYVQKDLLLQELAAVEEIDGAEPVNGR